MNHCRQEKSLLNIYLKKFLLHAEARLAQGQRKNNCSEWLVHFYCWVIAVIQCTLLHFCYLLFSLYVLYVFHNASPVPVMKTSARVACLTVLVLRTWMFGLDCDSDDGRGLEVERCERWTGWRCGDGGWFQDEVLQSTDTCRDTNKNTNNYILQSKETFSISALQ